MNVLKQTSFNKLEFRTVSQIKAFVDFLLHGSSLTLLANGAYVRLKLKKVSDFCPFFLLGDIFSYHILRSRHRLFRPFPFVI
jgi:hypothetical protein